MGTVLLIEDDDATAALLVELIGELGMTTQRYAAAEPALAAVGRQRFDLVVSDLWLVGMGNQVWDNIERLRAAASGVPFLVLTGDAGALEDGRRRGYRVLLKPFDVEEFEHEVGAMLGPSASGGRV